MRMYRGPVFVSLLLVLVAGFSRVAPAVLFAQAPSDPSGHWEGAISAPFGDVVVEIDLVRNPDGELTGTFSNQNLKGFPLTNVTAKDAAVGFEIKANGGGTFDGTLVDDGKTIAGDFAAAAGSVPFSLARKGDAKIAPVSRSQAVAPSFEGLWNGTLEVDGVDVHVALRLANHGDGSVTGTLANLDEGVELPIASITQHESNLILDVKVVAGSYVADLNSEGSELSGTWRQGSLALPLMLRKASTH